MEKHLLVFNVDFGAYLEEPVDDGRPQLSSNFHLVGEQGAEL